MSYIAAWTLFLLGIIHVLVGILRFKGPLTDAVSAGFIGQFEAPEVRRTAFWFLMCGLFSILAGHAAIHALAANDLVLLRIVGIYVLASSVVGVVAFPKSPFWLSLVVSPPLIAPGFGLFQ